ncbi:MAG: hypothetical protein L3J26_12180 [Candidatus Polarisedimenticolaceae bacterium]|nr:hypothetical protein [Candidatus Polarisedimenticolaceae bacterium]
MVSSLSISNYLAPGPAQVSAQKPGQEKPEDNRRLPADKVPQILDLEASRLMEQRLARLSAQSLAQESYTAHSQRAVTAYENLAANEERDRVSELLGIDLFA